MEWLEHDLGAESRGGRDYTGCLPSLPCPQPPVLSTGCGTEQYPVNAERKGKWEPGRGREAVRARGTVAVTD